MTKDDAKHLARLAGYVYTPIAILFLVIFVLVSRQLKLVDTAKQETVGTGNSATSLVVPPVSK